MNHPDTQVTGGHKTGPTSCGSELTPAPANHFAIPPCPAKGPTYVAVQYSKFWSGVEVKDGNGMNVLSFPEKPGAKFTTYENAKKIAEEWNK